MFHVRVHLCAFLIALLPTLAWAQLPAYTLYRLGPAGVRALAIDPGSQTVVGSATIDNVVRAVILTNGQPQPLPQTPAVFAEALGIAGSRIVGWYEASAGVFHAFVWTEAEGLRDLGTLGGTGGFSQATAVNQGGDIVGYASNPAGQGLLAVRWPQGVLGQALSLLPNYPGSLATQINNGGMVAGVAVGPQGDTRFQHAVLWDTAGQVHDLHNDTLGRSSTSEGLNNNGVAVGILQRQGTDTAAPTARAYVASTTQPMTILPPLPGDENSYAGGINDAGIVAGISGISNPTDGQERRHTLVIWVDGQPIDVLTLATNPGGWSNFTEVKGITEAGHIVGVATFEGLERTFLAVASTPEPAPGSPEDKERRGRGRDRHERMPRPERLGPQDKDKR